MGRIVRTIGKPIRFGVAASLSPADVATNWGTEIPPEDVSLTLAGLANNAGRQSAKFDFGPVLPSEFIVLATIDFTGETPTTGNTVDLYFAPSTSKVPAEGNVAGNSGLDAAAPGGALGSITLAEFIKQCIYLGSFVVHDGSVVQNGYAGTFQAPVSRYGQLIVVNSSGDAFEDDNVESHIVFLPVFYDNTARGRQ